MEAPVLIHGITGEALLSVQRIGDGISVPFRINGRGEQYVLPIVSDMKTALMEGSYYIASTPTPGTGITLSVAAGVTFSDTQGLVGINNIDTGVVIGGQAKRIFLDFIMWHVTTVPTAATQHDIAGRIDTGARSSGGTVVNPVNANMDYSNQSVGRIFANPTVVAASNNVRNLFHYIAKKAAAPAYIVDDVVILKFGGVDWSSISNIIATTTGITVIPCPPVAIGPGQSFVLNEWAPARSAALSGELFVGYVER